MRRDDPAMSSPSGSWRRHVGEVRGEVLAQRVADPLAFLLGGEAVAAEQLLLARDRLGAGDLPAHRQALEEELDATLPRVLLRERRAAHRRGVLAPGGGRHRAAQREHVTGWGAVLGLRRLQGFGAAAPGALAHRPHVSVHRVRKPTRNREVGRGERVLPGVWRLRLPLPWPGVPHCNAWALASGDGVVLVDTGMHEPGSIAHLERALDQANLRLEHVRLVVCTHAHLDHCGQAPAIRERTGAEVWIHPDRDHFAALTDDPEQMLARRLEVARQSGVPEAPLRRWAEQRLSSGSRDVR